MSIIPGNNMTREELRKLERTMEEDGFSYDIIIEVVETAQQYRFSKGIENFEKTLSEIPVVSKLPSQFSSLSCGSSYPGMSI
ncbi:hypothetical protein [Desulfocapsa sulfexigens]|nr:hypothetical protein [Desulfocapsa sulfexigens]